MTKIVAYLTKDQTSVIELWKSEPKYSRETGLWTTTAQEEVGTEIIDDNFFDDMLKEGECIKIEITKLKTIYNYNSTPEGKLMKAIYGKKK